MDRLGRRCNFDCHRGDMIDKYVWAAGALSLVTAFAVAQDTPRADISVDYSHLQVLKGYTISMNGGSASAAYYFNNWLGLAADFGGYHGYPAESLTGETFTAGPRFTYRRFARLQPFAEGLFGGSHFNLNSGGITGGGAEVALDTGAGLDIVLGHRKKFALRLQRDYFWVRSGGTFTVCDRLSAGLAYRFGKK